MHVPFPATLAVNAVLRALVRGNPEARQLLADNRGGLVALELQRPALSLRLSLQADGVELLSAYDERPDLSLSAELSALLALADAGHDPILDGRVRSEGDMGLARTLQQLLRVLGADWEAQLAPFFGDALAHKVGTAVRGLAAWGSQTRRRAGEDVGEYLQEEARLLVTGDEWRELERDSDALRERLDRLDARVQRAES